MSYKDRFWKSNWDSHIKDLDPREFNTSFNETIRRTFEELPEKLAIAFYGTEISYGELDKLSNEFAHMLIENGMKKGDVLGINVANIPEYVIGILGAMKAGVIVSGVSPLLSAVQIQYQLNDLGSGGKQVALLTLDAIFAGHITKIYTKLPSLKLVITTSVGGFMPKMLAKLGKLVGKIPKGKVTPLEGKTVLEYHKVVKGKYSDELPDVKISPDDIIFIQYTGGTTGPPKGARLSHRNFVADIKIFQHWLSWEFGTGFGLSGFPFFHIAGVFTCANVIMLGWSQVLIPNPRDTDHIIKEMLKYRPNVLANVPTLYQMIIKNPKFKKIDKDMIKYAVSAAAPFPKESQEIFEGVIGKGKIIELYGMTETSPLTIGNPSRGTKKLGHVGLPFPNVEFKLLDPDTGKEVPLGEPGEICIKGPMVMEGYHNKPEETKKAIDSDGFMHSGDVGIMDEEGYVRIADRTKDMIIVGGFKVFSAKLEDTLTKHPAIEMIATIGVPNPDRPGSEIVKAFIQIAPDYEFDGDKEALKENITAFAKEKCSPYEVPKIIEFTEELPLTVVGKVDKKVLRKSE
ncbi:MAG: AMP-dependent synthetase [Promethearchaeota archaeon Loki_b32]|nr:MAG: AMP-dependent synthetase [Candidatus Lokiarchaeota archaeon Loki_b32]